MSTLQTTTPKNTLAQRKPTFTAFLTGEGVKRQINDIVGGKDGQRFITSILSAVSVNPGLAECDHSTILSAAMLGEALKLSPSPQLGQYYMVPFKDNKLGRTVATFQLGYKGYIQLAIRSGQYKKLNVIAIKDGELVKYDPLNEEIDVNLIEDEGKREDAVTVGYYAMFEYVNGFKKTMYWSKSRMESHAKKYSKGYAAKKGYTFWEKDFDAMAFKTMLRQLISKWGVMSIEMQKGFENDMAIIGEDGKASYIDIDPVASEDPEQKQLAQPEADSQGSASDDPFEK
ncbi:MAG: recombinase RecT [Lactobacillales bacterium]|jgi:recombination protein RecT|nr:recombinase RecT [Lactobacillales bacterium]